jgi:hypothetical protein
VLDLFDRKRPILFCLEAMGKHANSIDSQILKRIQRRRAGHVFTPADFLDLGSRNAIDLALSRQARAGTIRKVARGLYDFPRVDPRLGPLAPRIDDIATALKGRDQSRLQPAGAHAANVLGLSTQVPVRVVFLTDGRSRRVQLGKQHIVLRHTTPRHMATAGRLSGTVIQALRWLGKRHVDDATIGTLRRRLSPADRQQLLKDLRYAPAWIAEIFRALAHSGRA